MKPDCNCIEIFLGKVSETNPSAHVYFVDKDLLTGSLSSKIEIVTHITTKSGREKRKASSVHVKHHYCAFCGKKYLEELQ